MKSSDMSGSQMCALIKPADLAILQGIAQGKRSVARADTDRVVQEATRFVERVSTIPSDGSDQQVCGNPHCGAVRQASGAAYKKCSRCLQIRYCCLSCQRQHWKSHKPSCSAAH